MNKAFFRVFVGAWASIFALVVPLPRVAANHPGICGAARREIPLGHLRGRYDYGLDFADPY
jgi:hypothetical protein